MSEYKHGSMDITQQEREFEGFIRIVSWVAATIVVLLILLAIFNG